MSYSVATWYVLGQHHTAYKDDDIYPHSTFHMNHAYFQARSLSAANFL